MAEIPPPAKRPADLTPRELGFVRRSPVGWLSPPLLLATAVRVLGLTFFGAYLDKRELQNALPARTYDHVDDTDEADEFWLDFVADLGDGFDATYSIAWLLAQPNLPVDPGATADDPPLNLPRGHVLVMGGDQVYPTPGWADYESRSRGPYRAALPMPTDRAPNLYALPGNHDWYDGLTAFLRVFAREGWIGGWRTRQSRSYFALELPHGWWLFAVDTQVSAFIDEPQLRYFEAAANRLEPGDKVILCIPQPAWVKAATLPSAYDPVDYFLRRIVHPTGADCAVLLTGDKHHYARYERSDDTPVPDHGEGPSGAEPPQDTAPRHLVTCGGGGAYLGDTAHLPERLEVPSPHTMSRRTSRPRDYRLAARYPDAERSRRYAWGVFGRLLPRNPGFAGLIGVLHLLLLLAFMASTEAILTGVSVGASALVLLGAVALAAPPAGVGGLRRLTYRVAGVLHGLSHLGLALSGAALWSALPFDEWWTPWYVLATIALYGPVFAVVGTELVALYFFCAGRFGINLNELFAAQGIEDSKSFLRMRIAPDGSLTIHPIAIDKVCHRWRAAPDDHPEASWIAPEQELRARLAEPPVQVRPGSTGRGSTSGASAEGRSTSSTRSPST